MPVTVFGQGAVQTAYVSFTSLDITDHSITLVWPTSYFDVPNEVDGIFYNVLAASMQVSNDEVNTNAVILPNAQESSVGSNFIITNVGLQPVIVQKSNGAELITIPTDENVNSYWVQLIQNSTPQGEWQFVNFGVGSSQAQASPLAGNGLFPLAGKLNTNVNVQPVPNNPYTIVVPDDRAKLFIWRIGVGTINLPLIANAPNGFYFSVNNQSSGILTIMGNAPIDTDLSITVSPDQSLTIISDGTNWWSLGFGQNTASSNFIPGSDILPSITFTTDPQTGIYYYNTPPGPVAPPGVGLTVLSSAVANFSLAGLYMNRGTSLMVQDASTVSQAIFTADADNAIISVQNDTLVPSPTLKLTGTNTSSTLELGPFNTLNLSQSALNFIMRYNDIIILNVDNAGTTVFPQNVGFLGTNTFNGPINANNTATFNGATSFTGSVTSTVPWPIASGGTGQNTQQAALDALMPATPAAGDIVYYDGTHWVSLPVAGALVGYKLTLTAGLIPSWQP